MAAEAFAKALAGEASFAKAMAGKQYLNIQISQYPPSQQLQRAKQYLIPNTQSPAFAKAMAGEAIPHQT